MGTLKRWSTRIPEETFNKIKIHCAMRGLNIEDLAAMALENYMEKYNETIKKCKDLHHSGAITSFRRSH